jgi:hypothetical protein
MNDTYFIKYSGVVNTFMSTEQAYKGHGLATGAGCGVGYMDMPAIAFSSKAECLFFIQAHRFYTSFGDNGMIPWLVSSTGYTYEMYEPEEVGK